MSALSLASARLSDIFSFLVFTHDLSHKLILHIPQLQKTANDNVTKWVTHRIFDTKHCAHFVLKINEKSSLTDSFQYDLHAILDSCLPFWATLYIF